MSLRNTLAAPVLLLALSVVNPSPSQAQDRGSEQCDVESLEGAVSHGETYRADFGSGLVFQLTPAASQKNPQGWTIEVRSREDSLNDYVAVATPPYRFSNPRYLDTAYGIDAEQAVRWRIREFSFVLGEDDFRRMHTALETLLWPTGHSPDEIASARELMHGIPLGTGTLRIVSAATRAATPNFPAGLIERLEFQVDLCTPPGSDNGG